MPSYCPESGPVTRRCSWELRCGLRYHRLPLLSYGVLRLVRQCHLMSIALDVFSLSDSAHLKKLEIRCEWFDGGQLPAQNPLTDGNPTLAAEPQAAVIPRCKIILQFDTIALY